MSRRDTRMDGRENTIPAFAYSSIVILRVYTEKELNLNQNVVRS